MTVERVQPHEWKATLYHLTMEQIGQRAPCCPECKEPLVARLGDRRFMEDDTYAQCTNGHVYELTRVTQT